MKIQELFGSTITQVFCEYGQQDGWLDTADCFIELDGERYVGFPFFPDEVSICELPGGAKPLFWADGRAEPVIGRKIVDFLWYEDDDYGGYFLLSDGTLLYEIRMSPQGTGLADLHQLENIAALGRNGRTGYRRLTDAGEPG